MRIRCKIPECDTSDTVTWLGNRYSGPDSMTFTVDKRQFAANAAGLDQLLRGETQPDEFSYTQTHNPVQPESAYGRQGFCAAHLLSLDKVQSLNNFGCASTGTIEIENPKPELRHSQDRP